MRLILFFLAFGAGLYGVLTGSVLGLGLAALGTLLAVRIRQPPRPEDDADRLMRLLTSVWKQPWTLVLALAVVAGGVAGMLSRENPYSVASGVIWLASLGLVELATWLHDRNVSRIATPHDTATPWLRIDWALALALFFVALALRLYRLGDTLPAMHGDEGEMGMLALLALHGPASGVSANPLPFFSTAFLDHPTLFHYLQAGALWLFGENLSGLRTLSALFGALCAPWAYALGRLGWGRAAGLAAGWLITVSHLHIHYSRIALNNIETTWLAMVMLLFFFCAWATTTQRTISGAEAAAEAGANAPLWPYTGAGLVMGLSQYFYYGSRLLPFIAAPLLLYLWRGGRIRLKHFALFVVATMVALFPLALHYADNLPALINRTRGVNVFTPAGLAHVVGPDAVWPRDLPLLVWAQVKANLDFLAGEGDHSSFYLADLPAFDAITLLLFWLGLGLTVARVRRLHEFSLLVWFGSGMLLAGVVTVDPPYGPRLLVMIAAVFLIGGVFVQRAYDFVIRYFPQPYRRGAWIAAIALAAGTLYLNSRTYFVTYAGQMPNLGPITMAHEMAAAGATHRVYLMGAPRMYTSLGVLRFVARDAAPQDLFHVDELAPPRQGNPGDLGLLVIAIPERAAELAVIEQRFPGGLRSERHDPLGRLLYVSYRVGR